MRVETPMTMQNNPPITVLMSVYNGEAYLAEAIESIISQTYPHFLFLIVDDASTDATPSILLRYAAQDKRIKIITNENNLGLAASLNKGLEQINTPYVARMDADDVSLPERLEKQLAYMETHPGVVVLGSWVDAINETGVPIKCPWFTHIRQYLSYADISRELMFGHSILVHPTLILRTRNVQAIGGYRSCFRYAQDYDLLLRLLLEGAFVVFPEVLLRYRICNQVISNVKTYAQRIANVCALSNMIIRDHGGRDFLQDRVEELDYNVMTELADAAGAIGWLHWLDMNSCGETSLTSNDLDNIKNKITNSIYNNITSNKHTFSTKISDTWLLERLPRIETLYIERAAAIAERDSIINSQSWRITAPLRSLHSFIQKIYVRLHRHE